MVSISICIYMNKYIERIGDRVHILTKRIFPKYMFITISGYMLLALSYCARVIMIVGDSLLAISTLYELNVRGR